MTDWPDVPKPGSVPAPNLDDKQGDPVTDDEKPEKKSASTVLVEIAQERYDFGVSDAGDTFGVPRTGPKVVLMLRGGKTSLRGQLAREYFTRTGRAAPQQALADALLVVEGFAQDTTERELFLRTARGPDGAQWLDLGDHTGRAVRITPDGWTIQDTPPVLFRRTSLNGPLPEPVAGGNLAELWEWLNVAPDDRPLVAAWLGAVLYVAIPHPILGLFGEQGTGKTTAEKVLALLLDPGPVPTRKPPRDPESWVTAAAGSWVVALDNLSDVPDWLSDSLCRAVTGDGDVRRKLYTDGEHAVFAFRRCLILNGIDLGALRGDLADRLLPVELHLIRDENRIDEAELWPRWREAHPRLLGAILDLAASVARVLPSVELGRKPRMADFARILAAVDQVLDTDGLGRYLAKQREMATDSLTGDVFVTAVGESVTGTFTGTAAELLDQVTPDAEKWRAPKGWPGSARSVTKRLKRQAPPMRKAGWTVDHDDGRNHQNAVRWTITPPDRPREAGNPCSPSSQDSREAPDREHASLASIDYGQSQDDQHPGCAACGQPLLLVVEGRDTCERCRIGGAA